MQKTASAYQKYIRQTPRKVRLVADLVRQMPLEEAIIQLQFSPKKAAGALGKVLVQAKANAVNNLELVPDTLKIKEIIIEEGPIYKRWRPVSRGRAHPIKKSTSHIKVTVSGETQ
jgi:large subunit ribosomal protein L22